MTSERVQRQIDRLLDEAEQAMAAGGWDTVRLRCDAVLALDPANADARFYLDSAARAAALPTTSGAPPVSVAAAAAAPVAAAPAADAPQTFDHGRYEVVRFLGEGGRKKVFLARDATLDRQVAFALIKTEGLDEAARERITREAQTMGRLGNHPNLVTVFDIGEHTDEAGLTQPWIAIELLPGGDVEGLLKKAAGPLALERTLQLAQDVCRGLVFLHSKGFVHRDLKPGNVWMTTDGTAKIGDYGLAMSADHTRLTLQGTMVGTVDYMPPEQALGGDINARSDLYSLGAMLYELVTGKPPFQGERIAEVISQHINVAPVAPSERGAQIPSALEALILELMAKAPAQRPVTAAAVLDRLAAIDPHDLPTVFDEDYRLRRARQVFVGRTRELDELKRRFDEAAPPTGHGQSRIVMVVGQPGIGKTRLAQELEAYARTRNARVFWGRAPEGGGAPEHWLFTQVLRRFLDDVDEGTARRLLGEDAGQLARIAPEIGERLHVPVAADLSEFALQEALRTFVHRLADDRPLLLILDDLHWADRGSLGLLQHASRDMTQARVLILGTYRDTELGRTHPLSVALATLNREPSFHRLAVRGIERAKVSEYIERSAGFEPAREQLDLFMRETDGNPFFLSEIVTGMLERGTLDDRTYALEISDGMREALARRVNTLSEDAVELLKLAAVVGYEFDFATLSVVSEQPDDVELSLIEEALHEHVIAEGVRPGAYRFVYEPMQRLLLDELSSTRRVRLHGQIGEQLEASYGQQAEQHAVVLARHFSESAAMTPAHREKALRYCWEAAKQAEAAEEVGAASRWYARALELLRSGVALRGVEEADVLAAWGRIELSLTGGSRAAIAAIGDAVDRFARSGQHAEAGRAALALSDLPSQVSEDTAPVLDRALAALGETEPEIRATLLAVRSGRAYDEPADADADLAGSLAAQHGLREVQTRLLLRDAQRMFQAGAHTSAIELASRAVEDYRSLGQASPVVSAQLALSQIQLNVGALTDAERTLREILRAQPPASTYQQAIAAGRLAAILLLRDDPEIDIIVERAGRFDSLIDSVLVRRSELRGDLARAMRLAERLTESRGFSRDLIGLATLGRLRYELGDSSGAREIVAGLHTFLTSSNLQLRMRVANALDLALPGVSEPEFLVQIADQERDTADGLPIGVANIYGSFDRTRAMWALALERLEEAERLVRRGLEWCVRERCPVEEGRCHQLLADVLRRKGEADEAREHLDAASTLFQQHHARLYLDQVLEQRDLLKA